MLRTAADAGAFAATLLEMPSRSACSSGTREFQARAGWRDAGLFGAARWRLERAGGAGRHHVFNALM